MIADDAVLLVRFVFPSGIEAWALPGGGLEDGEVPTDGLRRELHEELGLDGFEIGPHVWSRTHIIPMTTGHDGQRDEVYVVPTARFEPRPTIGWDALRREYVHEIRWWPLADVAAAHDTRFAPRRLGALLADYVRDGPPPTPIDTGV